MPSPIFLTAYAFLLSLLLTPLLRRLAARAGWLDQPDKVRKKHPSPVPRIGGVAIVLAYAGSFGLLFVLDFHGISATHPNLFLVWKLLPAAFLVFLTGLLDDLVGLTPKQKLLGELLAAATACLCGIQARSLAGFELNDFVAVPLTIFWLVCCTNAFNLIDGMDGLAGGLGLLGSLTIVAAGVLHNDARLVLAVAPLAGALLGFLLFNFNPASIFLGDCGSLWVGFMLAGHAVMWSQQAVDLPGMAAPMMALSIPLLDTALSILRRFLRRQRIFVGDHDHIHHRLLRRGFTPRRVVGVLYAAGSLAACLSLLESSGGGNGLLVVLFCAVVGIGVWHLGYREFEIAVRWLRQNSLRKKVQSHVLLSGCEESLRAAANTEECWQVVRTVGHELGFGRATLRLGSRSYQENLNKPSNQYWVLHIPLSDSDYVRFSCPFGSEGEPMVIAPLADLLRQTLSVKAAEFRPSAKVDSRAPGHSRTLESSIALINISRQSPSHSVGGSR